MHIRNIFDEGELKEEAVCKDFLHTAEDGKNYNVKYYNLDLIISLGYRVKSQIATKFRIWATQRLREYIVKGFAMDDERLKENWRDAFYILFMIVVLGAFLFDKYIFSFIPGGVR